MMDYRVGTHQNRRYYKLTRFDGGRTLGPSHFPLCLPLYPPSPQAEAPLSLPDRAVESGPAASEPVVVVVLFLTRQIKK